MSITQGRCWPALATGGSGPCGGPRYVPRHVRPGAGPRGLGARTRRGRAPRRHGVRRGRGRGSVDTAGEVDRLRAGHRRRGGHRVDAAGAGRAHPSGGADRQLSGGRRHRRRVPRSSRWRSQRGTRAPGGAGGGDPSASTGRGRVDQPPRLVGRTELEPRRPSSGGSGLARRRARRGQPLDLPRSRRRVGRCPLHRVQRQPLADPRCRHDGDVRCRCPVARVPPHLPREPRRRHDLARREAPPARPSPPASSSAWTWRPPSS